MNMKDFYKNRQFMKYYLLTTIVVLGLTILFDLLGILNVTALRIMADLLIFLSGIIIFVFVLLLYININEDDELGKKITLLNHGLLIYLGIIPVLVIIGIASSSFLINPTTIGIASPIVSTIVLLTLYGYGIGICIICILKIDDSKLWNF
ncbi:MAG: hypothetical protein ACTSVK_17210 [Promethearchaeota archaeon]